MAYNAQHIEELLAAPPAAPAVCDSAHKPAAAFNPILDGASLGGGITTAEKLKGIACHFHNNYIQTNLQFGWTSCMSPNYISPLRSI
jgi:hypothetical protein